jgi:hypothetical protein
LVSVWNILPVGRLDCTGESYMLGRVRSMCHQCLSAHVHMPIWCLIVFGYLDLFFTDKHASINIRCILERCFSEAEFHSRRCCATDARRAFTALLNPSTLVEESNLQVATRVCFYIHSIYETRNHSLISYIAVLDRRFQHLDRHCNCRIRRE